MNYRGFPQNFLNDCDINDAWASHAKELGKVMAIITIEKYKNSKESPADILGYLYKLLSSRNLLEEIKFLKLEGNFIVNNLLENTLLWQSRKQGVLNEEHFGFLTMQFASGFSHLRSSFNIFSSSNTKLEMRDVFKDLSNLLLLYDNPLFSINDDLDAYINYITQGKKNLVLKKETEDRHLHIITS